MQELIPPAHLKTNNVSGTYFLTNSKLDKLSRNNVGVVNNLLQTLIREYPQLSFEIEHQPKKHGVSIHWQTI